MNNRNETGEVILFVGPESSMVYEFDGHRTMAVYEPDYERQIMVKNFKKPADMREIEDAIRACEAAYLKEVE